MGVCVHNGMARPQHQELRSLLFARSLWVLWRAQLTISEKRQITASIPFWILIFQEITSDPNLQSTVNARMYVFAVIRQASPVQLRAGLNGGLCTQWHGQTTTPRATFLAICEKFVGTLTCPANHFREETGGEVYCLSSLFEKTITSNS